MTTSERANNMLPYDAELLENGNFKIDGAEFTQDRVNDAGVREIHRTEGAKITRKADAEELKARRAGNWEDES